MNNETNVVTNEDLLKELKELREETDILRVAIGMLITKNMQDMVREVEFIDNKYNETEQKQVLKSGILVNTIFSETLAPKPMSMKAIKRMTEQESQQEDVSFEEELKGLLSFMKEIM